MTSCRSCRHSPLAPVRTGNWPGTRTGARSLPGTTTRRRSTPHRCTGCGRGGEWTVAIAGSQCDTRDDHGEGDEQTRQLTAVAPTVARELIAAERARAEDEHRRAGRGEAHPEARFGSSARSHADPVE